MRKSLNLPSIICIGASILFLLGAIVIVGWLIGSVSLVQINPQFVPMQFNTAVGFILLSLALVGLSQDYQKYTRYISIALILLGGLTLAQHLFGINLFIDEIFIKHYITVATSYPGRMAPNTALNFLLGGIAILVVSRKRIRLVHILVSSFLGALIMGLATVAVLGYLSNIQTAYGWGRLTEMALHTAVGFMIVGFLILLEMRSLSNRLNHKIPVWVLPVILSFLGITITLALWQALYVSDLYVNQYGVNQYGIRTRGFVVWAVLAFGGLFSLLLAIATWFATRSREQLNELKSAQAEILQLNQKLEKLSYLDGLTEIANRRAFDIAIEEELHRAYRHQYPLALIMIDIDYFKDYNDFYGHQLGDVCIKEVARTINSIAKRKTDTAARYGGEEFVVILPAAGIEDAKELAAMTLQAIMDLQIPHAVSKINSFVTVSAGVCVFVPQAEITPRELIRLTDQALYAAKAQGRNCFVVNSIQC